MCQNKLTFLKLCFGDMVALHIFNDLKPMIDSKRNVVVDRIEFQTKEKFIEKSKETADFQISVRTQKVFLYIMKFLSEYC